MITPHGGRLIDKTASLKEKEAFLSKTENYKNIKIGAEQIKDVKNIARGVYSPLEGFLKEEDFKSVVSGMRLKNGTIFSIPIVLDISESEAKEIRAEKEIILTDEKSNPVAVLFNPEIYPYDKDFFVENVFGTRDKEHPGVSAVYGMKEFLIGGEILLLDDSKDPFPKCNFSPAETRKIFEQKGWEKIVAFQTRNVPHCGHEFLQLEALKKVDGLFVQPVIGEKKIADFKDEYILATYEVLIDRYYPRNKTILGILPLRMRYAGPREAVFHAIIRKNFGCTHFIVGRDHAGVGKYYPPFAAQEIFDDFKGGEIGIEIMKFPEVIFCPIENKHAFIMDCPHPEKISFSGTKLREFIDSKKKPPAYLIRPEVYYFIAQSANSLVDDMYKNRSGKKGFVLWFTGLSQSGKTTNADAVCRKLLEIGKRVERLDGDVVRQYLSHDLGFSKSDRDENIRRIGFVSETMARNGIGVITSFISPYRSQRNEVRKQVESGGSVFIEIFCNCPLDVCASRDTKGLYEKAKRGEITNFTGISDPYEAPENPEIELKTSEESVEKNAEKIFGYLKKNEFI